MSSHNANITNGCNAIVTDLESKTSEWCRNYFGSWSISTTIWWCKFQFYPS